MRASLPPHFGKWHVGRVVPARHGFEENDGPNNNGGPENVENPNPKPAFGIAGRGMDFMARPAKAGQPFYLHIPHCAGLLGNDKLTRVYETGARQLYDLTKDPAERHDLAKEPPQKVAELDKKLTDYLKAVNAQMPTPNPKFDPSKPQPPPELRGGGGGGKGRPPIQ